MNPLMPSNSSSDGTETMEKKWGGARSEVVLSGIIHNYSWFDRRNILWLFNGSTIIHDWEMRQWSSIFTWAVES